MDSNVAIVVTSCDAYSDLWNDFFALQKKNWSDCQYDTFLVSNNLEFRDSTIKTIKCGEEYNWTGRLKFALSQIEAKYIILLLEDYYISEKVASEDVNQIIELMERDNVNYYKLEKRGTEVKEVYEDTPHLYRITKDIKYGVSLTTAVWNKEFLEKAIGDNDYTAWEFELSRNSRNDCIWDVDGVCLCDVRNVLNITHMVQRGKYIRSSVNRLKKLGISINNSNRGKLGLYYTVYLSMYKRIKNHKTLFLLVKKVLGVFGVKSISEQYEKEVSSSNMYK